MSLARVHRCSPCCCSAACGASRPPWAEGAMVREPQRPRCVAAGSRPPRRAAARAATIASAPRPACRPLAWDAQLAAAAAAYGPALAPARPARPFAAAHPRPGQGENLWMGTRGAYSLEEMVGSWAEERAAVPAGHLPERQQQRPLARRRPLYPDDLARRPAALGCALHQRRALGLPGLPLRAARQRGRSGRALIEPSTLSHATKTANVRRQLVWRIRKFARSVASERISDSPATLATICN